MVWQVAQVIAPPASAAVCPRRIEGWAPWQPVQARAGDGAAPGAGSMWHAAQARPAFSWGSERGPGAPLPPGGGTMNAAAIVAAAPAPAAARTPRKRVTSLVGSARAVRPWDRARGWAARSRGSARRAL